MTDVIKEVYGFEESQISHAILPFDQGRYEAAFFFSISNIDTNYVRIRACAFASVFLPSVTCMLSEYKLQTRT